MEDKKVQHRPAGNHTPEKPFLFVGFSIRKKEQYYRDLRSFLV
jgi:hypothetical protein